MSGVNKVILVGNVGKDPEVKYISEGVAVAKFPLATSETYKKADGTREEKTEWHNVVLWRGLAEITEKYIRKGKQVYIEGKIQTRSYEQDGVKKYITEIVAETMTMLGSKLSDGSKSGAENTPSTFENSGAASDDLPF